jgi:hypothetical protein
LTRMEIVHGIRIALLLLLLFLRPLQRYGHYGHTWVLEVVVVVAGNGLVLLAHLQKQRI